jgi:hypothetical protein
MATLTNNVNAQNIIDRFADYVAATANSGIVWGTNALPFPECPPGYFGGTTAGRTIAISGNGPIGGTGVTITASIILATLLAETYQFTKIRNFHARLTVTGGGGNTPAGPHYDGPGTVFDQTQKSHLTQPLPIDTNSIVAGDVYVNKKITTAGLEDLFDRLRALYNSRINYTIGTVYADISVCHGNCHSSCHGSRSRR